MANKNELLKEIAVALGATVSDKDNDTNELLALIRDNIGNAGGSAKLYQHKMKAQVDDKVVRFNIISTSDSPITSAGDIINNYIADCGYPENYGSGSLTEFLPGTIAVTLTLTTGNTYRTNIPCSIMTDVYYQPLDDGGINIMYGNMHACYNSHTDTELKYVTLYEINTGDNVAITDTVIPL